MSWEELGPSAQAFFQSHMMFGVFLSGFMAFIESLAVIGSIVPGSIIMGIIGLLLGTGILPIKLTLISIFIGAFIGDYVSYFAGLYYKDKIKNHHFIQPYQHWLQHTEALMRRHGVWGIIIGRFFGPMRSVVPMVAGIAEMNIYLFTLALFPTILLWSIVYLSPGYFSGALLIDMGENQFISSIIYTVVLIIILTCWYLIHGLTQLIFPSFERRYPNTKFNAHTLTHLIKGIILLIVSTYLMYLHIIDHTSILFWNNSINYFFLHHLNEINIYIAQTITLMGEHGTFVLLNIALLVVLYFHNHRKTLLIWMLLFSCIYCLTALIKFTTGFSRPDHTLALSGFPSGHVILNGTFWLCLSSIVEKKRPSAGFALRRCIYLFIMLMIFSRLTLQAHWFIDLLITSFLTLSIWHIFASQSHLIPDIPTKHLKQIGASISLIIVTLLMTQPHLNSPYPTNQPYMISVNTRNDINKLPKVRYSRLGQITAPLNYTWIGSGAKLKQIFLEEGWIQYSHNASISKRIYALLSFSELNRVLPVFPPIVNNHAPDFIFTTVQNNKNIILRLWRVEGKLEAYIGTVSTENYPESYFLSEYFICATDRYNISSVLPGYEKGILLPKAPLTVKNSITPFCWDGRVLFDEAKNHKD